MTVAHPIHIWCKNCDKHFLGPRRQIFCSRLCKQRYYQRHKDQP